MPGSRSVFPAVVLTLVLVSTGCADDGTDATRAGAGATPVTLRLGTADHSGSPGARQIEQFAHEVEERSSGRVRVEPVWQAHGDAREWDQTVAAKVTDGEFQLAVVPSRAWTSVGVTSLQALSAPFLVTDQAQLSVVTSDETAERLMSGLEDVGVLGLGLVPEGLRRPFSFDDPLLAPEHFTGKVLRAPAADVTAAVFEALGATVDDPDGPAFATAVADGAIDAAESQYQLATGLPAPAIATDNVVFFPKVNVFVLSSDTADGLGAEQVAVLVESATATRDWALSTLPPEAEQAELFCASGGTVVTAGAADVEALRETVRPVVDRLAEDPLTAELIAFFEELPASVAEPVLCGPDPSAGEWPAGSDEDPAPTLLDGQYRYETSLDYLLESGLPVEQARADAGVFTVTMRDGVYEESWRNEVVGAKTCTGEYVVAGSRMFMRWTPGAGCQGAWAATATAEGDTIRWSDIRSIPPDPPELTADWEVYLGVPWTRIGDGEP